MSYERSIPLLHGPSAHVVIFADGRKDGLRAASGKEGELEAALERFGVRRT